MVGLLDAFFGGGDSPPVNQQMPQIDPRLLMLSSMAAGVAPYMGASHLPHSTGQALAGAAGGIGPGLMQGYQAQQAGLNNAMAQQQFQMLQDALQGKGAFAEGQPSAGAGGGGSPAPGVPVDASAAPGSPQSTLTADPNSPGAELRPTQGGLLGGGGGVQVAQNGAGGGTASDASPSLLGGGGAPSAAPASGGETIQPTAGIRRDVWGLPLPPGMTKARAYLAAKMNPDGYKAAITAMYADKRPSSTYFDGTKWVQAPPTQMPGVDPSLRVGSPEYLEAVQRLKNAEAWGGVGADNAKTGFTQRAMEAREKNVKGYEYGLEYGGGPGGAGSGAGGGGGPPPPPSGVPLSGGGGPSLTTKPMLPESATKPMQTPEGSFIPPISEMAPVDRSGANLKSAMPEWNKTRTEWYGQIKNYDIAEQRIEAISDAFAKTKSGAWATDKAEFAGKLKAVGIDIGDKLGSLKDVQIALKDNWAATLEQMKGISSRGPTEREIMASSKNFANPELQPEANHGIAAQTLGTLRWERKMIQDYKQYGTRPQPGAPHGWENPLDWQASWAQHNPLKDFVAQAERDIPPFMGMPGNKNTPAPPATFEDADAEMRKRGLLK